MDSPHKKEYDRTYREEHKEHYKQLKRLWRKNNPEKYKAANINRKEYFVKSNKQLKSEALKFYSNNKLECNCCKENNIKFLTIDHINGNGNIHRKNVCKGRGGRNFYSWLKRNNYPVGFQVLCYNCNCGKSINKMSYNLDQCPHKDVTD